MTEAQPLDEHVNEPATPISRDVQDCPAGLATTADNGTACGSLASGEPEHRASGSPPSTMLALIERAVFDKSFDISRLQTLLEFQRELMADNAKAQFNEAFARLQPRLPRVKKNGEVWYPIEKNSKQLERAFRYARWDDIDLAIRPLLNEEGFSLSFDTASNASGGYLIIGKLSHTAGHERTATFGPVPLDTSGGKNNLQGAASSLSYGKRHTGSMLLNLVFEGEDDDGTGGAITEEQAKTLRQMLISAGRTEAQFLRYMRAETIETIAYKDYPKAESALKERISKEKTQ